MWASSFEEERTTSEVASEVILPQVFCNPDNPALNLQIKKILINYMIGVFWSNAKRQLIHLKMAAPQGVTQALKMIEFKQ
jgi:hypothetical protein